MRKLALILAVALTALAATSAHAQVFTNGNFETGVLTPWVGAGNSFVETNGAAFGGTGKVGFMFSESTAAPPGAALDIGSLRAAMGSGATFADWSAATITGNTNPPPLPMSVPSGTSWYGSAIYQDFTGTGGNSLVFDWNFITNQKAVGNTPPNIYVDFGFVSIQGNNDLTPTIMRLADTTSPLLTVNGPNVNGFNSGSSSMTGMYTSSITLPAGSTTFRIGFGVTDVGPFDDQTQASALAIDNAHLINSQDMATSPQTLAFGNVRYGTSGTADVTVTNVGANPSTLASIAASAPTPSGEFTGGGMALPDLVKNTDTNPSETVTYTFSPTNRGAESAQVTITSDGSSNSSDTIDLSGVGVGPTYNSSSVAPGGTLNFGSITTGTVNFPLTLSNPTLDGNLGDALTGLTILDVSLSGVNSADYTVQFTGGASLGDILQPSGGQTTFGLLINFHPSTFDGSFRNALLTVQTDQGAALGVDGALFTYNLVGFADFQQQSGGGQAPEPGALALWSIVGLAGAFAARRKFGKRK